MADGKPNRFVFNALLLSAVSILLRAISVSFNSYINNKIGSEGMGLFTLVMSVYGFGVTVALSCVNFGAVRLTSEKCALLAGSGADRASWKHGTKQIIHAVTLYSLIFGVLSALLLFASSGVIGNFCLKDGRTVRVLRLTALSLPAISLSSGICGYFTGLRKITKNAVSAISEQAVKIIIISTALAITDVGNVEKSCMAIIGGSVLSEVWSLIFNIILYLTDSGKPSGEKYGDMKIELKTSLRDVFTISFPSAVGTYARQGLTTLEHMSIPAGLRKSGLSHAKSLSSYGLLQGIAFPLVMFPYAIISSFTSLLIPEIAGKKEISDAKGINGLVIKVFRYISIFSVFASAIFFNYSNELGMIVYSSKEASVYTLILGLLVPFMYLDTAVDSILKGLGEQVYTMKVNMIDASCGLIIVLIATPAIGIYGYLLSIWICEVGNLYLSIRKLGLITGYGIKSAVLYYIRPYIVFIIMSAIKHTLLGSVNPVISIIIFTAGYMLLVDAFGIKKDLCKTSL